MKISDNELLNENAIFVIQTSKQMDIQVEKLHLIERLARLNNATVLKQFIALKNAQEKDWWEQISAEEKSEIEEGLAQANRGELVDHKEVMAKYKRWR